MNVIKKIFQKDFDTEVHEALIKFGKGTFNSRFLLEAKNIKGKYSIKTSAEYVNNLLKEILLRTRGKVKITGVIVSTFQIDEPILNINSKKQFMGIKQFIINTEIESNELIKIMEKYPRAFFALSFSLGNTELKTKAKAPKSAKPSTKKDAEVKADFCSLKTTEKDIVEELFFDFPEFKHIKISHTINVDSIDIPLGESDPVKIRDKSIRNGKVTRNITKDEESIKKEANFRA